MLSVEKTMVIKVISDIESIRTFINDPDFAEWNIQLPSKIK